MCFLFCRIFLKESASKCSHSYILQSHGKKSIMEEEIAMSAPTAAWIDQDTMQPVDMFAVQDEI